MNRLRREEIGTLTDNPAEAVKDADVVYTDTWTSMGREKEAVQRRRDFKGFQVNDALLKNARKGAIVMHCLPAHRGEEITDDVIDGPRSVVLDQAAFDQGSFRMRSDRVLRRRGAGRRD